MLTDLNFPQQNFLWTYAPGYDPPAHVTTDEKGMITETITKWKLSKEDLEFVNTHGYIYLRVQGGQLPVCLEAEPIFEGE